MTEHLCLDVHSENRLGVDAIAFDTVPGEVVVRLESWFAGVAFIAD